MDSLRPTRRADRRLDPADAVVGFEVCRRVSYRVPILVLVDNALKIPHAVQPILGLHHVHRIGHALRGGVNRIGWVRLELVVLTPQPGHRADKVVVHEQLVSPIDLQRPVAHVSREHVPLPADDAIRLGEQRRVRIIRSGCRRRHGDSVRETVPGRSITDARFRHALSPSKPCQASRFSARNAIRLLPPCRLARRIPDRRRPRSLDWHRTRPD